MLYCLPLAVLLAAVAPGPQTPLVKDIQTLAAQGSSSDARRAAWQRIVQADAAALPHLLRGMDTPNTVAANWLRTAFDLILERALKDGGKKIPVKELLQFAVEVEHQGRARRLALGVVEQLRPGISEKLFAGSLNDPEFRYEAVDLTMRRAAALLKLENKKKATELYRTAFDASRDVQQGQKAAAALLDLGVTVSTADHLGFLTHWYLIGPFDALGQKGFKTAYPPESKVDLQATYAGKDGKVAWKYYHTREPSPKTNAKHVALVNLAERDALGNADDAVAFAYTEFVVDKAGAVEFRGSADDNFTVWVNGVRAFGFEEYRNGVRLDRHRFRVKLKEGKNTVLVKVIQAPANSEPNWEFFLRVVDGDGNAVAFRNALQKAGGDKQEIKGKKVAPIPPGAIKPAPLKADKVTYQLPSELRNLAVGGGGRYLLLWTYRQKKAIYVFDVNEAKIVKELPLEAFPVGFTAGLEKFFVVLPKGETGTVIHRYSLATFEKEASAPGPETVTFALLGNASTGPILLGTTVEASPLFYDPRTLKPLTELTFVKGRYAVWYAPNHWRAAADGRVFTIFSTGGRSEEPCLQVWTGRAFAYGELNARNQELGVVVPGPDSRHLYSKRGRYTTQGKPLPKPEPSETVLTLPTVEGTDYFLNLRSTGSKEYTLSLNLVADGLPVADLKQVELPKHFQPSNPQWVEYDQRLLFIPSAKLLIGIPEEGDRLELYRVDPEALLAKCKRHVLEFTSLPPTSVSKGRSFTYTPRVLANKGEVKLTLEGGPEGMKMLEDGQLTWEVPRDFDRDEAVVVLVATDATGKERLQTFRMRVRN